MRTQFKRFQEALVCKYVFSLNENDVFIPADKAFNDISEKKLRINHIPLLHSRGHAAGI